MSQTPRWTVAFSWTLAIGLAACGQMPTIGPSRQEISDVAATPGNQVIQIVDVDDTIARRLLARRSQRLFSESLGIAPRMDPGIGLGDSVEVILWEAPPAALFGASLADLCGVPDTARATTLPEQVVDRDGFIDVPFAGRIHATGLTPQSVAAEVVRRLQGKANRPEAPVRVTRNASSNVLESCWRDVDPAFAPRRALDFGCGVGRVALALAETVDEVVGRDVAPAMLAEAQRDAIETGRPAQRWHITPISEPANANPMQISPTTVENLASSFFSARSPDRLDLDK